MWPDVSSISRSQRQSDSRSAGELIEPATTRVTAPVCQPARTPTQLHLFPSSTAVTRPIVAPTPSVRWAVCTFCGWATIDCARCRGASVSCASSTGVRVSTRCQPWSTVIQWSGPRWTSASAASMQSPSTSAPVTLATQTIRRRTLVDIADIVFGRPLGRVLARCVDRLSVVCNTCIVAKPYDVSGQRRYHWISRWRVPIGSHMSQSAAVWPQF